MPPRLVNALTRLAGCLRTRRGVAVLALLVGTLVLLFLIVRGQAEPSHQKLSASEWLELVNTNQTRIVEVTTAFRAMGPAGAEYLGNELLRKPSRADEWLLAHHAWIPDPLKRWLLKPQRQAQNEMVLKLLTGLGRDAAPAMPMLITWLENSSNVVSSSIRIPQNSNILTNFGSARMILITSGGSNLIRTFHPPAGGHYMTKTQTVVMASGLVTTNVVLSFRYASNTIPVTAYHLLTNLGSTDPRIVPVLLRPTDLPQPGFPSFGTNLKTAALQSLPLLIDRVEQGNISERVIAISLLKLTLPESAAARESLIRRLEQRDQFSRDLIIGALAGVTNDLDRIVPFALDTLIKQGSGRPYWQSTAYFTALSNFSRQRPQMIPRLQELLPQASTGDKIGILQVLGEVGNSNNVNPQLLRTYTKHYEAHVRTKAWFALGNITGDIDAKLSEQLTMIEYGNDDVVWQACAKLGSLGPAAVYAIPVLQAHLHHQNERIVAQAAESLGQIGYRAKATQPNLEALREHPRPQIRAAAEEAIRKISATPKAKGAE